VILRGTLSKETCLRITIVERPLAADARAAATGSEPNAAAQANPPRNLS